MSDIDLTSMYSLEEEMTETGIVALDIVLGGGTVRGDCIEFASASGVGKSTTLLHVVKYRLSQGAKVFYFDVERGVKTSILKNMGLLDKVSKKPKIGDPFILLSPKTYTEVDKVLFQLLEAEYDMGVIDSITAVQSSSLIDQEIEKVTVGWKSRLDSQFLMKYKPMLRDAGCTLWLLNQMRTEINISHFRSNVSEESAGGFAMKHFPDIRLRARKGPSMKKKEETVSGNNDVIYGNEVSIWSVKNRFVRPEIPVTLPVIYGRGVSNKMTILSILKRYKMLGSGAAGYFKINWKGQEITMRGDIAVLDWIGTNFKEIKELLKKEGKLELVPDMNVPEAILDKDIK